MQNDIQQKKKNTLRKTTTIVNSMLSEIGFIFLLLSIVVQRYIAEATTWVTLIDDLP